MATKVSGVLKEGLLDQLWEVERQIRQANGYRFDPDRLRFHLQGAIEGRFIERFVLFVNLGIVTVPDDYEHATALDKFMEKNRKKFYSVNGGITDANFPHPTRVLKPGQMLHVRAFKQVVGGTTTSEERMAFLATQHAIHTGAQGASLVWQQKRNQLPKGNWYTSFDEKDRLWVDAEGYHRVPFIDIDSNGDYWYLDTFEDVWNEHHVLLCFCDVE